MENIIKFKKKPVILATFTIGGPKESSGPMSKYIHKKLECDKFGETSFERAERKMLTYTVEQLIKHCKFKQEDIDAVISGDLLNQIISASFMARNFDIPYLGVYNACSTMSESLILGASLVDAGYYKKNSRCYNNDWTGEFFGKDGVKTVQDFLNSPKAQENAQIIFKKKQWGYLKAVGAHNYLGLVIKGILITPSGLLAGAHLKGAGCVINYLKSRGIDNSKDAFGTSIESYIKQFAGYDVSKITGNI